MASLSKIVFRVLSYIKFIFPAIRAIISCVCCWGGGELGSNRLFTKIHRILGICWWFTGKYKILWERVIWSLVLYIKNIKIYWLVKKWKIIYKKTLLQDFLNERSADNCYHSIITRRIGEKIPQNLRPTLFHMMSLKQAYALWHNK